MTVALNRPLPLDFQPPLQNPSPNGLYAATAWQPPAAEGTSTEGPAVRHLQGVHFRPVGNYGGEGQFGIWPNDSCSTGITPDPDLKKEGLRPADDYPWFDSMTLWAYDECDPTEPSRADVFDRAQQILRLEEQVAVETEFAERMKADATREFGAQYQTAASLKLAVGYLEGALALTNTLGFIHAGAQWASQEWGLAIKSGTRLVSPLGHTWVFGGGYVEGLDNVLIATSPVYGWRDEVTTRVALDQYDNTFIAIAERTVAIGYEAVLAAVTITG